MKEEWEEALDACRQASSPEEHATSWKALLDRVEEEDDASSTVVRQILIEWPYNGVYAPYVDQFLDACDVTVVISTCARLLQELGRGERVEFPLPTSSILQACWHIMTSVWLEHQNGCEKQRSSVHLDYLNLRQIHHPPPLQDHLQF